MLHHRCCPECLAVLQYCVCVHAASHRLSPLLSRDLIELDVERRRTAGEDTGPPDYTPLVGLVVSTLEQ